MQANFAGLTNVIARMTEIEKRFQPQAAEILRNKPESIPAPGKINPETGFSSIYRSKIQSPQSSGNNSFLSLPQRQTDSGGIENIVYGAAQKYGVDPKLALAIAKAESGLDPNAVSATGAIGVMQLMPSTATGLGVRNIYDPRENIDGGVHYLKQMLDTFQGDIPRAVAAYNAGPEAVKKYGGIPPYNETQQYVQRVLTYYQYS